MKRISIYIIALVTLGAAALTSCKKEFNGDAPTFTATLEYNEKTQFTGGHLYWSENDQVAIYGSAGRSVYNVILTGSAPTTNAKLQMAADETAPGDPSYTAIYPAAIAPATNTEIITLPATQASVSGELTGYPMYAPETSSTFLHFKNLCSVLKITMQKEGAQISKIQIITDQYINGDFEIDGSTNTLAYHNDNGQNNHKKVTTLTFSDGPVSISDGHDFYIYLPANTYDYFQIKVYDQNGNMFTRTTTSGLTFNRSEYNYLTIPTSAINFKPGDLLGEFSVSATEKVSFSKGNLLQSGSTYKFADKQYNKSETGYTYLYDWANGTYETANYYERGNLAITNGGGANQGWFTMNRTQWHYLAFERTVSFHRFCLVRVTKENSTTTVGGMLLFPDQFIWPLEQSIADNIHFDSDVRTEDYDGITLTYDQWLTLEYAGCAFLPASGMRTANGSSTSSTISNTDWGTYWTTTPYYQTGNNRAYYMRFTTKSCPWASDQTMSTMGNAAIRLVRLAE